MNTLTEKDISCPYCGETITVLIDGSLAEQSYIEDCQVCCRPIDFDVAVSEEGDVTVGVRADDE